MLLSALFNSLIGFGIRVRNFYLPGGEVTEFFVVVFGLGTLVCAAIYWITGGFKTKFTFRRYMLPSAGLALTGHGGDAPDRLAARLRSLAREILR